MAEDIEVRLARLEERFSSLHDDVQEVLAALKDRDQRATEERRSVRAALIGLTGAIATALIAAIATVIASGAV